MKKYPLSRRRGSYLPLIVASCLKAAVSLASPRLAMALSGDCQDPVLIAEAQYLGEALSRRPNLELFDSEPFLNFLRPVAARKPEEVARAIESAQKQFYQAEYSKAQKSLAEMIEEIGRLPVGSERQRLYANAQLLLGLVLRAQSRIDDADEAFRNVLRRDPDYQLDVDYFSPTVRAHFEDLRSALLASPKSALSVSSTSPGAEVFADGYRLGITPLRRQLPLARYQLVLRVGPNVSLLHRVELRGDTSLLVDVEFESSLVSAQGIPCLSDRGDTKLRFEHAMKLGALAALPQIIVVWLEREAVRRVKLAAALIDRASAREIRSATAPIATGAGPTEAIDQLAAYLDSGSRGEQLAAFEDTPAAAISAKSWKTPVGMALGVAGLVAGGVAATFAIQSDKSWSQFNGYYARPGGPLPEEASAVAAIRDRAEAQRATAIVAGAVAAASLGTGLYFFLSDGPSRKSQPIAIDVLPWPVGLRLSAAWR